MDVGHGSDNLGKVYKTNVAGGKYICVANVHVSGTHAAHGHCHSQVLYFFLQFFGHTLQGSGVPPGSVFKLFMVGLEDHMWCLGLNPRQQHSRQMPYAVCYRFGLSSPL